VAIGAPSSAPDPVRGECLLPPGITEQQVRDDLARILASPQFNHSERMNRFLRFVVETVLAGQQEQLKEYLIGLEVFDRNHDYDPHLDPIVRVEARRLRAKLKEYYETEGGPDALVISMPKGSYVPIFNSTERDKREESSRLQRGEQRRRIFERREVEASAQAVESSQQDTPTVPRRQRLSDQFVLACFLAVLGSLIVGWVSWRQLHPARAAVTSLTLLASDYSEMGRPAFSPNGNLIAYASDPDGEGFLNIYVKELTGMTASRISESKRMTFPRVFLRMEIRSFFAAADQKTRASL